MKSNKGSLGYPHQPGVPKKKTDQNDEILVERLKKKQEWAFIELVNRYQERLLKIAYGITLDREESLEIVQDVFVSVFKNISSFRQDAKLYTWLRKITVNHCLNWKRKWKRRFKWHHQSMEPENDYQLFEYNKQGDTPETLIRGKQQETNLMNTVKDLPEKIRLVFVLSTFEGLSYQEIGDMLNIKKGTVSSRLHTARTMLMESMAT